MYLVKSVRTEEEHTDNFVMARGGDGFINNVNSCEFVCSAMQGL